jgi:hypothetical protein
MDKKIWFMQDWSKFSHFSENRNRTRTFLTQRWDGEVDPRDRGADRAAELVPGSWRGGATCQKLKKNKKGGFCIAQDLNKGSIGYKQRNGPAGLTSRFEVARGSLNLTHLWSWHLGLDERNEDDSVLQKRRASARAVDVGRSAQHSGTRSA